MLTGLTSLNEVFYLCLANTMDLKFSFSNIEIQGCLPSTIRPQKKTCLFLSAVDAMTLETIARAEYMSFSQIRMYSMNRLELLRFTARFSSFERCKKVDEL